MKLSKIKNIQITNTGALILFTSKYVFKFPINKMGYYTISQEKYSYMKAKQDVFFMNNILPSGSFITGIKTLRGNPIKKTEELVRIDDYILEKLRYSKKYPFVSAEKIIDYSYIHILINYNVEKLIQNYLKKIYIPNTPAHGDLHIGNLLMNNGEIAIIDWGGYKKNSSFCFDAFHYYVRYYSKSRNKSWVDVIFSEFSISKEAVILSKIAGQDIETLSIAYAINRASLEIEQFGDIKKLKHNQKKKYVKIIELCQKKIIESSNDV
ncbi:phosphotransferase [Salimicrobium humidisoli]|uniref:Aminoglycoside phosphotransferase domain-containing protein n=1 Tax=Salimicrobium humidisoli TaxID=2029857 RepID=A0ABX4HVF1_9BACI|nr:phosphotransferase [Salimicrobium humidisoli]PBB06461.1 hypothetical protein CKW00_03795 [Salimicrobium humidisoli]